MTHNIEYIILIIIQSIATIGLDWIESRSCGRDRCSEIQNIIFADEQIKVAYPGLAVYEQVVVFAVFGHETKVTTTRRRRR